MANQQRRVGVCAVCGAVPDDARAQAVGAQPTATPPNPTAYRVLGCWRVLVCVRHGPLAATVGLDGRLGVQEAVTAKLAPDFLEAVPAS